MGSSTKTKTIIGALEFILILEGRGVKIREVFFKNS